MTSVFDSPSICLLGASKPMLKLMGGDLDENADET